MKTIIQFISISLVLGSCCTLKQKSTYKKSGMDDVYVTPKDEELIASNQPVNKQANSKSNRKAGDYSNGDDYRKYKEVDSEELDRDENSTNSQDSTSYSNGTTNNLNNNFSNGTSIQRLSYGDAYRDGYNDAYNNLSVRNNYGCTNNYYYANPYTSGKPAKSNFWSGYSCRDNWNYVVNTRNSYYGGYYQPWYGYNSYSYGYYSYGYSWGSPYGYYNPYEYSCGNNGNNNSGYRNYYYDYNSQYKHTNTNPKGSMQGPRETIENNSPTSTRQDQISPKGRGEVVKENNGVSNYDSEKAGDAYAINNSSSTENKTNPGQNTHSENNGNLYRRIREYANTAASGSNNYGSTSSNTLSNNRPSYNSSQNNGTGGTQSYSSGNGGGTHSGSENSTGGSSSKGRSR